jgi:hypothetical protein
VRFQILTAAIMKFRVWDVAPRSHVEDDRRFRDAYGRHHQSGAGGRTHSETSVNFKVTTRRYIPEDIKLQDHLCC